MPKLGTSLSLNARNAPALDPRGIPVAGTNSVIVTNSQDGNWDYTYVKDPVYPLWEAVNRQLFYSNQLRMWRMRNLETPGLALELHNPSTNTNFIPTSGWTKDGSPFSITITAA